ncbi:MAG: aldehyde dehydrogenase (NADP(+)) [Acidobacteria bacterium]|nr:MAG: aldehyde dehydrogenase (NADP(+)) [Acidobacteriota bacterium]
MQPTGANLIAGVESWQGETRFRATDPATGATLAPEFVEATGQEVDAAARAAGVAFPAFAALPAARRARFLRAVAEEILGIGEPLVARAAAETGLPRPRLEGERGRTVGQLRMFADLVEEGSWVDARIDRALPDRAPLPRPDLRRMLVPLGPVAVFGASNFPLAFSVAGGDTASALAAGCPVVVKAHPAHPGTSELASRAILAAAARSGVPAGAFSMVQGPSPSVGLALVTHPEITAVGFTGSFRGGRALFEAAARREEPIPVFAEMGSANPVFVLPGALLERGSAVATGLAASVTLGAGQFCTNPGLTFLVRSEEADRFLSDLSRLLGEAPAGTMCHEGIRSGYEEALSEVASLPGVRLLARSAARGPNPATEARPALLATGLSTFRAEPRLAHEVYGPVTLAVLCDSESDLVEAARSLPGHLVSAVHGTPEELAGCRDLVTALSSRAGRVVVNGFPTGVEVSPAMQHGGPWPATTDARFTSVGTAAILRWARPVTYQDAPASLLPEELRDANPSGILRLVDGTPTREAL